MENEMSITVQAEDASEQNQLTSSLMSELQELSSNISVVRSKSDRSTLDFGSTLILVFGTPVAIALANGLREWLARHSGARITVEGDKLFGENLDSDAAARILEAWARKQTSARA